MTPSSAREAAGASTVGGDAAATARASDDACAPASPARSCSARSMAFKNLLTSAPSSPSVQPTHGVGREDEHGDDDGNETRHGPARRPHRSGAGHEALSAGAFPRRPL